MITKIEHVGFMAKDTVSLSDWYVKNLGFEKIYSSSSEPPIVFIKKGDGMIVELFPWEKDFSGPKSDDKKVAHLCLYSTDLDRDLEYLKKNEVEISGEIKKMFGGSRAVFFRDEEGNWLHLVERKEIPWE
ncbi:MAG: VOC family protein [Spirochaetia bacterium]|nr:VOC family protein [Spirochaetia bacterium]MCF7946822.1 VOC family protein [Spirochaetia bacterium]MCF7953616.1 VOC family protein [Spirochaetales bacterium]